MKQFIIALLMLTSTCLQGQCLKADIIFLLDWSSSEHKNRDYIPQAAQAFVNSMNLGPSAVKIGVIPFNDGAIRSMCLQPSYDQETVNGALRMLESTYTNGGTDFSDALLLAEQYFAKSEKERGSEAMKIIIFISDGGENFDRMGSVAIANAMKSNGTAIWCIATPNAFIGENDDDREHLKAISSGADVGYFIEEYYDVLKEELLRMNLCP